MGCDNPGSGFDCGGDEVFGFLFIYLLSQLSEIVSLKS